MYQYLSNIKDIEPIIIDNNSTYTPLLNWYNSNNINVIRLKENLGHMAFWESGIYKNYEGKEYYGLTDPDLDLSNIPTDFVDLLLNGLNNDLGIYKCGFTLEEKYVPPENPSYILDGFIESPTEYWKEAVFVNGKKYYNTLTDTTFCIYSPNFKYDRDNFYNTFYKSLRSDRPYTADHLPWYITSEKTKTEGKKYILLDDELYNYYSKASKSSQTKKRMKDMLETYDKTRDFKFLIILFYYNRPDMVQNALLSLKHSNFYYQNWKLLFIDDGSPLSGKEVLYDILKGMEDKIEYANTGLSADDKNKLGGSLIGKFANEEMIKKECDYGIMLCDDDALYPDYLYNLNKYFHKNPNEVYAYSHVIRYNPEVESFYDAFDRNPDRINEYRNQWTEPIDPLRRLDASQVCWRINDIVDNDVMFDYPRTVNLDASIYERMYAKFGPCKFTGFVAQIKGFYEDALSSRQWNAMYEPKFN
jgi:hypothetical protein